MNVTARTYEICYRYKDGLATTTVWASTEEQAEKVSVYTR